MADQPQQGAMTYEAQAARDAQARGYGDERYGIISNSMRA
jgi:hypothetical protein